MASGAANTQEMKSIDAKGMSVMPGFIDAHRHVNTGPNEKVQMQQLLEAGVYHDPFRRAVPRREILY